MLVLGYLEGPQHVFSYTEDLPVREMQRPLGDRRSDRWAVGAVITGRHR